MRRWASRRKQWQSGSSNWPMGLRIGLKDRIYPFLAKQMKRQMKRSRQEQFPLPA
jgi:hypothetical protein